MDERIAAKRAQLDEENAHAEGSGAPRKLVDGVSGFEHDESMGDLTALQQTKHHAVWTGLTVDAHGNRLGSRLWGRFEQTTGTIVVLVFLR